MTLITPRVLPSSAGSLRVSRRFVAGEEKWGALKEEIQKIQNKMGRGGVSSSLRRAANTVEDIVFAHLYPRLDIAVSRHLNHLLKAPFAIHPKTGRVCTPMDISKVDDFDPTTVPTIGLLFEEMEKLGPDVKRKSEWQHTSMKGPVEIFKKFVEGLSIENQARRKELGGAEHSLDDLYYLALSNGLTLIAVVLAGMEEAVDFLSDPMEV